METKICKKCGVEKELNEFHKHKDGIKGVADTCKDCRKLYYLKNKDIINKKHRDYCNNNKEKLKTHHKEYREKNKDILKIKTKKYYDDNKEKISLLRKKHRQDNKDLYYNRGKEYREKNKEKCNEYQRKYHKLNKKHVNKRQRKYEKDRYKNDNLFRIKKNLRCNIYDALTCRGFIKSTKTEKILGCSMDFFIKYIESKFLEGMSWENRSLWHLDHIIPMCTANTQEEAIKLNHYTNLQPLWAEDNFAKGTKILN